MGGRCVGVDVWWCLTVSDEDWVLTSTLEP
jgi:hypothetical protein